MQPTTNSMRSVWKWAVISLVIAMLGAGAWVDGRAGAQDLQLGDSNTVKKGHVSLISDSVDVPAGTPEVLEIRFKVDDGYHVNSHKPKDELLIPTALTLDKNAGVKVLTEDYPAGTSFRLDVGDGETLDVYQGEFRVKLRIVATKGPQTLTGSLHYQACDHAACFPPKTLPIKVAVNGK